MTKTELLGSFGFVQDVVVLEYRVNASPIAKASLGFVSARDYSNPVETAELAAHFDFGS